MDQISLTKSIFETYRLSVTAFMMLPDVTKSTNKNTFGITCNPVLYIRYKPRRDEKVDWNDSAFKINPKNLYRVVRFFNRAVSWFYDKDLEDLYLVGDNNELIFNSDYNKLNVMTDKEPKSNMAMKIIPAVVTDDASHYYEGVILYINKTDYAITLTLQELESLLNILTNLSFESLITELIMSFFVTGSMGRITQADQNNKSYGNSYSNTNHVTSDQWE